MNTNELINLMQLNKGVQIIAAKFVKKYDGGEYSPGKESKTYYYKHMPVAVDGSDVLKKDDHAIVMVCGTPTTIRIEEVFLTTVPDDFDIEKSYDFIVSKIDYKRYDGLKIEEANIAKHLKKAELMSRISEMEKQANFKFSSIAMHTLENKLVS